MCSDEEIVRADWLTFSFQCISDRRVSGIGRFFERQDVQSGKNPFYLRAQPSRASFLDSVPELRGNDDAGANFFFANLRDLARDISTRIANQVRQDVRIEEELSQRSTASGIRSAMWPKSSSSGLSCDRTSNNERFGAS